MPLLTLLLLTPLLGAIVIQLQNRGELRHIRSLAILFALLTLGESLYLLWLYDLDQSGIQFAESVVWNAQLGTSYALGVDGLSLPMVLLTTLLSMVAILASTTITENTRAYYVLMLLLETAILGVFMAGDWALFYLFWEMTLIPLFFLIDRWGGVRRSMAALNFVLYTMGGSVFMLVSLLILFDATPEHSFAMESMLNAARALPSETQYLLFLGFLIGFGVKMPIFPIHGWLPLAHVEAPSPVSILLSGILLKMGAYGLFRAGIMLPAAITELQTMLMILALFSMIYGGILAWKQTDMKAMIAYSSISHMGVVLFGLATLNGSGLVGSVTQMVAHGLSAGALFLLIGLLYQRTHTREISHYSSLVRITPRFAFLTSVALFGAIGIPGTAGFIAELHIIIGGFERWGWIALIITSGVIISASYALRTVAILFTGPVRSDMSDVTDLQGGEYIAAIILVSGIVLMGLFPGPLLEMIGNTVTPLTTVFSK